MTQIGLECFFDSIITWLISSKIIKIENFSSFVLSYSHKLLKRKLMDDMINRHDSIAEENIEPVVRLRTSLRNGAARLPTVPMTHLRMTRKTVPLKIVRNV
mgnify:CR=1 FL=1